MLRRRNLLLNLRGLGSLHGSRTLRYRRTSLVPSLPSIHRKLEDLVQLRTQKPKVAAVYGKPDTG